TPVDPDKPVTVRNVLQEIDQLEVLCDVEVEAWHRLTSLRDLQSDWKTHRLPPESNPFTLQVDHDFLAQISSPPECQDVITPPHQITLEIAAPGRQRRLPQEIPAEAIRNVQPKQVDRSHTGIEHSAGCVDLPAPRLTRIQHHEELFARIGFQ